MKRKTLIISFASAVVFVVGAYLIFLAASRFLATEPAGEMFFEPAETEEGRSTEKRKDSDYPFPDFELSDLDGKEVKLSDFKGKIIVLSFWTTWNAACQDQIKILDSYYQGIKGGKDVILFAVNNLEDKSAVFNFVSRGQYDLPVLLDDKGGAGESYQIGVLPATYFIDRQGRVKEKYVGILSEAELKEKIAKLYL